MYVKLVVLLTAALAAIGAGQEVEFFGNQNCVGEVELVLPEQVCKVFNGSFANLTRFQSFNFADVDANRTAMQFFEDTDCLLPTNISTCVDEVCCDLVFDLENNQGGKLFVTSILTPEKSTASPTANPTTANPTTPGQTPSPTPSPTASPTAGPATSDGLGSGWIALIAAGVLAVGGIIWCLVKRKKNSSPENEALIYRAMP